MVDFNSNCCVCLKNEFSVVSITNSYSRGKNILFYLEEVAAEIKWKNSFMICASCLEKLDAVIEFRTLCLNSNSCRHKQPKEDDGISSDYDNENILEDRKDSHTQYDYSQHLKLTPNNNKLKLLLTQGAPTGLRNGGQSRKFRCQKCGRSYSRDKFMKKHSKICDGIKRHSKVHFPNQLQENRCSKCSKCYTTKKILGDHMKRCCGLKTSKIIHEKCYSCNIRFEDRTHKHEHVLNVHAVDIEIENTCSFCYLRFERGNKYAEHLDKCRKNLTNKSEPRIFIPKISCNVCLEEFASVTDVVIHCQKEHQLEKKLVKPYSCAQCRSCFAQKAYLIRHMDYHSESRNEICTVCGKTFINRSCLKAHERIHKNKRSFKCGDCDKAFKTHNNLLCHRLVVHTHATKWKYCCQFCEKKFPLKSSYDLHTKRHINDKKFSCVLCGKSFISKTDLRKHSLTHMKMPGFECSGCGKGFNMKKQFNAHLLTCVLGKNHLNDGHCKEVYDLGSNQIEVIELTEDEVQAFK